MWLWWKCQRPKYRLYLYNSKLNLWTERVFYNNLVLTWWDLEDFEKSEWDLVILEKKDWLGYWDRYKRWDRYEV